jgi:hypothetical protein
MVYKIVWRDKTTGNITFTGLTDYPSWEAADEALRTLWGYHRSYTPTIEKEQ